MATGEALWWLLNLELSRVSIKHLPTTLKRGQEQEQVDKFP